ncbi:MAG: hypothetical protein WBG54_11875 [Acidobacteriaceae bacterium]
MLAVFVLIGAGMAAQAERPLWAKHATAFNPECEFEAGGIYPTASHCRPIEILSPAGKTRIDVVYGKPIPLSGSDKMVAAHLLVKTSDGRVQVVSLPEGFQPIDLQWAPDSRAFFVNGGNGGAYWGFWVWAYSVDAEGRVEKLDVMRAVGQNMYESFPPCKARGIDPVVCSQAFRAEQDHSGNYNISGIDWSTDPRGLVVMAEVPCSSSEGGIMCQMKGYIVSVPDGKILKQMSARELKRRWQPSMAFQMQVPGPPEYGLPTRSQ